MEEMKKKRAPRGAGRIFARPDSDVWWIQFSAKRKQIRESTGIKHGGNFAVENNPARDKAARLLRKRLGQVEAKVYTASGNLRYEDLRELYFKDYVIKRRRSLRHDREGRPYSDKVARLDAFFSGWKVDDVELALEDFILDQQNRGLKDSTINRSMSALRRMFRLALKKRMLTLIPAFPMLEEPDAREGFFEEDEYRRLSGELPEHLRLPLALGFFTGMRLGEVLAVGWDQVNLIDNTIRLRGAQTKSGKPRLIPVIPQLRALIEKQHAKRQAECPYVCFSLDRKGHAARINGFRKAWYSACVRAGLGEMVAVTDEAGKPVFAKPRGPRSRPKVKMTYKGRIFHDLRRSAVRNLIRSGVPRSIAMDISGHRTESVFERYNIGSEADIHDAREKLGAYHTSQNVRDVEGTFGVQAPTADKLIN